MAHGTTQHTFRADGDTAEQRVVFKNGLILTVDSDNKISSVYGYIPALSDTPVFIIAKDGFDIFEDILGLDAPDV